MNKTQEALRLIKVHDESGNIEDLVAAYNKCKEALAQPAQEPVAWMHSKERLKIVASPNHQKNGYTIPLYTHPVPSWQGLSNNEIRACLYDFGHQDFLSFARAIETKLKEKNT